MKRWFTLAMVVVAIFATTTAHAAVYSRDFGDEDAERLAKLATAELGDASARVKADFIMDVLGQVWRDNISIEALVTHYPSAELGTYIGTQPDPQALYAVEMVRNGYNSPDKGLVIATRLVWTLEWMLPLLTMLFTMCLLTLICVGLERLQGRIGRR